ncbi:MAG: 16S rRNA (cytosine(1402)-N(4))-methyltransferase RsmH [Candidatus Omnitrophica bacterium]|nr:16S rRNA (cytosine(1402)-N(4))-methyltransferase RsmH [Candidatus Omnitrophota bacterium]
MADAVVRCLAPRPGGVFLDATVGGGGHSRAILQAAGPAARVVAMDRDPSALVVAADALREFAAQMMFRHGSFEQLTAALEALGVRGLDGAVFDLGVSSLQLETAPRGFSIQADGPLDMRMDPAQPLTAAEVVNRWPGHALADAIAQYGEERWARRIARRIVQRRPMRTTGELAACVLQALPPVGRSGRRGRAWQRIHPATRTFQALRIVVNRELEALAAALPQAIQRLRPGGRIVVLAYHSLEDRIVKQAFRRAAAAGEVDVLTRRPLRPGDEEVRGNPRSRSARLRAAARRA